MGRGGAVPCQPLGKQQGGARGRGSEGTAWPMVVVVASGGVDQARQGVGSGSAGVSEFSGPWADGCPQLSGGWSWVVRAGGQ